MAAIGGLQIGFLDHASFILYFSHIQGVHLMISSELDVIHSEGGARGSSYLLPHVSAVGGGFVDGNAIGKTITCITTRKIVVFVLVINIVFRTGTCTSITSY